MGDYREPESVVVPQAQEAVGKVSACYFPLLTDGYVLDENVLIPAAINRRARLTIDIGSLANGSELYYFCSQHGLALSTIFNKAWALVLGQYTDSDHVSFVSVVSASGAQRIGVCEAPLDETKTIFESLKDAEKDLRERLQAYTPASLAEFVDATAIDGRDAFNSIVVFQEATERNGLVIQSAGQQENGYIVINVRHAREGLSVELDYPAALLPKGQAENVASTFGQVLAEIASSPNKTLHEIDFMSQRHLEQIWGWNKEKPEPVSQRVHALFEQRVRENPTAHAVDAHDGCLTYRDLDDFSNRLAHHLVSLGLRPETAVPLFFEKSKWAIIAMLAVVKAGGAIVNLEANQPRGRLLELMGQIKAPFVLSSRRHEQLWENEATVVVVDGDSIEKLPAVDARLAVAFSPSNMLYIIYTSGSTGTPKGVVVEHESFLTAAAQHANVSNMSPNSRILQMTPYTFDVSMLEIFTTLTTGACICSPGDALAAKGIAEIINALGITWTFMTPSLVRLVNPADVPTLRTLALGGEALGRIDVVTWADKLQLINGYGPSECSVAATINDRLTTDMDPANIGVGKGATCWVVDADDHNRLVPIGAVGELVIQGPIVARGYFNAPDKTAEVFLDDAPPFAKAMFPGSQQDRLYKTGDLVRNNSDGTINFIGRKDRQVKLRGLRIELGEIEHRLARDEEVRHAFVALPKKGLCSQRLVGVLTLHAFASVKDNGAEVRELAGDNKAVSRDLVSEIRERVSCKLASYMVPTAWLVLEALPFTTSGKINAVAMTKWIEQMSEETYNEVADVAVEVDEPAEATEVELLLQAIWCGELKLPLEKVRLNRSFISLGGDSIMAMKVAARCRAQNIDVKVQDIILAKSLSELASKAVISETPLAEASTEQLQEPLTVGDDLLAKLGLSTVDIVEDIYACSPMQEGILLSQVKIPGTYEIKQVLRVNSSRDITTTIDRLKLSWQKAVDRHASLRTVFVDAVANSGDSKLFFQVVLKAYLPEIKYVEYANSGRASDVSKFLKSQPSPNYQTPQPPHQLTICRAAGDELYIMVELSHAIIDGGSTEILLRDMALAFDEQLTEGSGPRYGDYISYLEMQPEEEAMNYWTSHLAGVQPAIVPMYNGNTTAPKQIKSMNVEFDQIEQLLQFSEKHGVTVANIFQTAWGLVLREYTGSDDVCFGYVASGRDMPVDGIHEAVGAFINMLVSRLVISKDANAVELVQRMQGDYFASLPHQHCSLAKIQHGLNMSGLPLFNTILSLQKAVSNTANGNSVSFEPLEEDDPTDFDIAVSIHVGDTINDLGISLGYWSSLLSDGDAENIANTFSSAISRILEQGSTKISQVDLFNERDHQKIWQWNKEEPVAINGCVHDYVYEQVLAQPNAQAVCAWDGEFTYAQLDELSTKLAHHIADLGVGPEVLVPHCFDKSKWSTVSTYAIMKAGGAGVGLSSSHPLSRIQSIIEGCNAKIVLVAPQHAELLEGLVEHIVVVDPSFVECLPAPPKDQPLPRAAPHNPAFVSFTSGSTGKPKGIVLEHRSLITTLRAHGSKWGINRGTRVLQFASYAFDASVSDTYTTLVRGGTVCIPSEKERLDDLAGAINRLGVDWAFLTPRVLGLLSPKTVPGLKSVILGGEALSREDIAPWADSIDLRLVYGPTECTIYSSGTDPVTSTSDPASIGRAVATRLWVTDPDNTDKLVPVGCIGELVIEGPLVTRGYLNDPERTGLAYFEDPKFLPKRLSGPPRRFYKTSDLVRYYPDGQLQFIGRKDTQVKIRGQRVELGEIEHAILENLANAVHITVDAVVFQQHVKTLVAYLFLGNVEADDVIMPLTPDMSSQLRVLERTLTEILPSYMVPSMFIPISRIPMTISGKVDRVKLRAMTVTLSAEQQEAYSLANEDKIAPTTESEITLQAIWSQILNKEPQTIGTNDSFFRLGGDSIGAMKLVVAARKAGLSIAVKDIFRYPELAAMAQQASVSRQSGQTTELQQFELLDSAVNPEELMQEAVLRCNLGKAEIQDIYPCTPLQEGVFLLSTTQPGAYVAQSAFKLPPGLDLGRFQDAWQSMVKAHPILRTRIITVDSTSYQVVLHPESAAIQWREASSLQDFLEQDKTIPVLHGDPLARYGIVKEEESPFFVWTSHHAIYDGWSVPVLFEQLERIYNDGQAPTEASYARFIQHIQAVDSDASDAFWRSQLSGDIPASYPRLPNANYEPRPNKTIRLSTAVEAKPGSDITMAILLRAAWALVVGRYADSNDIVYGLTLSGRDAPVQDIEDILGPTITTVPINVHLDKEATVEAFLNGMQQQNLDMMPFQHTGLQKIRRVSSDAPAATEFTNLFVVQPQPGQSFTFLGLEEVPTDMTQFDTYALLVECGLGDRTVEIEARFDDAVLSEEQVQRLLYQFETVIEQLNLQSTTTKVGEIDLCSEQDKQQIMKWNAEIPVVNNERVHDLFSRQAEAHPDTMAIESWDGKLTYAQLDDLTSRLACHLSSKLRIVPETLVPMCFDKSMWTVVTMMAVVKAGGACVMLNPDHPFARLQGIIDDTGCHVVLTAPDRRDIFESSPQEIYAISGSLIEDLSKVTDADVQSLGVTPTTPAVVIFTSGSTGKSKGIVVQNNSLCTVATQHGEGLGFAGDELRVLQFAAYTFDVSVGEIFVTLMRGGTICIPTEYDRINNLAGVINSMGITWTFMTPTVAALLDPKEVPNLKTLVLGGEAVSQSLVDRWASHLTMIDSYGPAECTIWTSHALPSATVSPSNIGHGVACRLWVVEISDHNRLSPVGCVGELLIEGPNVSRGYLNEPEKTNEAYIENPVWAQDGSTGPRRFYKSGDLVSYAPDGSLIIAGRKDAQVKFHGQRIELGEIEFHLRARSEVEAGMIAFPKSGLCKGKLVAALALSEFQPLAIEGNDVELTKTSNKSKLRELVSRIQDGLSSLLPPYMVPSIWVVLDSIPLTASRKINRVPITKWVQEMSKETYLEVVDVTTTEIDQPTTTLEKELAEIWAHVLDIPEDQIGANRSFLSLGGDSITAMQVVSRCRSLKIELSVRDIIQSKSLSEVAVRAKTVDASRINVEEEYDTMFPLSPIQQLYFEQVVRATEATTSDHHYNQSILLRLMKRVPEGNVTNAFRTIVKSHSMLRARFALRDGEWMQSVPRDSPESAQVAFHSLASREDMFTIIESRQTSLDIQNGPVFALDLFTLPTGEQLVFLVAHHLVVDAVSWRVIVHNFEELLESKTLSMSTLPFQLWTKEQAEYAKTLDSKTASFANVPASNLKYWGMPELPTWNDVEEVSFVANETVTSSLLGSANDALHTEPVDILISVIQQSFAKSFTDRAVPAVFSESHGREPWDPSIDLTSTVGWFTTFYPVNDHSSREDNLKHVVRRVKDARRQITDNGFSYFSGRYLNTEQAALSEQHKTMEICFNYLGRYQQLERADALLREEQLEAGESINNIGKTLGRLAVFDISASVTQGQLHVSFFFNRTTKHLDRIQSWIKTFEDVLTSTVNQLAASPEEPTLSDFSLMSIDYDGLSKFTQAVLPNLGVSPSEVEDLYPCSPLQEGILLSQARQPGTYEVRQVFEVVPRPDAQAVETTRLHDAWQQTVNRHAILRTIFTNTIARDGVYDQLVLRQHSADVKYLTCDGSDVAKFLEGQEVPDYTQQRPHHRMTICEAAGKVYCQLEVSHSLIDGTSLALIIRDFTSAYEGTLAAGPGPLYKDYIAYLQERSPEESLNYWTGYLYGVQPCHFPRLRDDNETKEADASQSVTLTIDPEGQLQKFCREKEIAIGNLFQAAWGLVLRTYTGSDDVCFGYMAAGRDIAIDGLYDAIGPYINMLVCRLRLSGDNPAEKILRDLQTDYLNCLPHQHTSLATIQHELDDFGKPLFNSIMSFQRLPAKDTVKPEISFEVLDQLDPTEYDVDLSITTGEIGGTEIYMSYLATHLHDDQAQSLIYTFSHVLMALANSSEKVVSGLQVFSDYDRAHVMEWNKSPLQAADACVHSLIETQAEIRPMAEAIRSWDGDSSFTYGELEIAANTLAAHLHGLGVGAEVVVPICFDQSSWAIVSMLAVLKAGAAYCAVNQDNFTGILQSITSNPGAYVVVCSPRFHSQFASLPVETVLVDEDTFGLIPISNTPPTVEVTPRNLAAVVFESQGTDTARALLLEHRSISTVASKEAASANLGRKTRALQFAPYTSAVSMAEILYTLANGGVVCVPSTSEIKDDPEGAIQRMDANWAFLTPTVAELVDPLNVPSLKTLLVGGESVSPHLFKRWSLVDLITPYGFADNSLWIHNARPKNVTEIGKLNVSADVQSHFWIADMSNLQTLVPVGCTGELVVEGPIAPRGYWNDGESTQSLPWSDDEDQQRQLYRTGDVARYTQNKTITRVGRGGAEHTLNGQAIDLDGIERQVKQAAPESLRVAVDVVSPTCLSGEQSIAVFIAQIGPFFRSGSEPVAVSDALQDKFTTLKSALNAALPRAMMPKFFIAVSHLPIEAHNKVDRAALRQLASTLAKDALEQYSLINANADKLLGNNERIMRDLWVDVLKLSHMTITGTDSFFRLGGDSIGAMRLVNNARSRGLSLTVAEVFQNPALSDMAEKLEILSENEEALEPFTLLSSVVNVRDLVQQASVLCNVSTSSIEDIYPCTPLQEGLMAITAQNPFAYTIQDTFKLPETLNIDQFRNAWETLATKSTILRTNIITASDGFFQVLTKQTIEWQTHESLDGYLKKDRLIPMGYGQPLARYAIVGKGPQKYFVWTAHHSIYDGFTMPMLAQQVAAIYNGELALPEIPYNRFIQYLRNVDAESTAAFWKAQFPEPSLSYPPLPNSTYQPDPSQLATRTVSVTRPSSEIPMSTVLRAAWALVLARFSESDRVAFGAILSGRNAPIAGITQIMGPTITTVPISINVKQAQSSLGFLEMVHQQSLDMLPFEQTGLQNIRSASDEAKEAVDFRNLLVIQPAAEDLNEADDLGLTPVPTEVDSSDPYPLSVECTIFDDKVEIEAQYDGAILSPEVTEKILKEFDYAIQKLNDVKETTSAGDEDLMEEMGQISDEDIQQILEWNGELAEYVDSCVHMEFERQTRARPNAPAVESFDVKWTYSELNALAEKLAHHLLGQGVVPEMKVPLLFHKCSYTIVAMLAIMKAGGTCAMLNPEHPPDRLATLANDVGATFMVCSPEYAELATQVIPMSTPVSVDHDFLERLPVPSQPVTSPVQPSNAVFIQYTSGSTGKPKGSILEHRALVTSLLAHCAEMSMGPDTRTFQFASYTFDVSIEEIWGTLMLGGCICVPSEEERMNAIGDAMNKYRVTWSEITTTVATLLVPSSIKTLKTLCLSGEPLNKEVINMWAGSVQVINSYGPSECCVSTTCNTKTSIIRDPTNIGTGLGCHIWLVNPDNIDKLAPIGSPGELLIEGPILARGYLNEPQKTAEAFIKDPAWAKREGGEPRRFYRSGDLMKYNPDGTLKFIGRKDTQVKLHGQRIEMGEIEHQIKLALPHSSYQVAVEVITPKGRETLKILAAFICEGDATKGDIENMLPPFTKSFESTFAALQAKLLSVLPKYMVPSFFLPLSYMPQSPSRKLDRKLLRETVNNFSAEKLGSYSLENAEKRAPSTPTEKALHNIWVQILGIQNIGVDDNFFLIGGDSIAAMRVVAASSRADITLTVSDMVQSQTLSKMAEAADLSTELQKLNDTPVAPFSLLDTNDVEAMIDEAAVLCGISRDNVQDIYPCTPLQEGLMALTARDENAYVARAVYRLPLTIDIEKYKGAWEALANVQAIMRTRIIQSGLSKPVQVVVSEDFVWHSATSIEEYVSRDSILPMVHGQPLMRFALVPGDENDARFNFVYTAHHSVYDGWSESTMFEQVELIYKEGILALPAVAPYKNFIRYLSNTDQPLSDTFWRSQFEGSPPANFPTVPAGIYEPRPNREESHPITLTRQNGSTYTTPTVLKAAWSLLLSRYTGSDDVLFGHILSGRTVPLKDVGDMVGPAIATVPIRVQINRTQTIGEFMSNITQQASDMMPFEQAGLQHIRQLAPQGASDFNHLFYVQPTLESDSEALGLEIMPSDQFGFDTYGLLVECQLEGNDIDVHIRFDDTIISQQQITWILHHFENAVHQLTRKSLGTNLNDVSLFGERDLQQALKWAGPEVKPVEACVHDLVKAQAERNPQKQAIDGWDGSLTYAQLDREASRLSSFLTSLGVTANSKVALCFNKSSWAIVSMLAVLKAGGACVMLNPEHPIARLTDITSSVGAEHMLASSEHAALVKDLTSHLVVVDEDLIAQLPPGTEASRPLDPSLPAYLVFTSGSTGKPKAVVIEHRAISTSMRDHSRAIAIDSNARALQFAAYTFDISFAEIFTTLACGGTVCVISDHDRMNNLAAAINDLNVNWACLTPTVATLLTPSEVPGLNTLALSGECPTDNNLTVWGEKVDRLFNIYGPSEASVWCCGIEIQQPDASPSTIGTPVGCRLWIAEPGDVDRLAPIGCAGELLVEGPILAQQYLDDVQKTMAAFVVQPVWMRQHNICGTEGRVYRTGDLAKYNDDGTIEYLGRIDTQIKLRGQRIEPREIEHHIKDHLPETTDVAVDAIPLAVTDNNKTLVAYFYPKGSNAQTSNPAKIAADLSDELQQLFRKIQSSLYMVLPAYMVPSMFIPVSAMPTNSSGKMDRLALRDMVNDLVDGQLKLYSLAQANKRPPQSNMEIALANLWAQVLHTDLGSIGLDDSFFRLGGDSISAMKLVNLSRASNITMSVVDIFRHPTLLDAAAFLKVNAPSTPMAAHEPYSAVGDLDIDSFLDKVVCPKLAIDKSVIADVLPTTDFQDLAITGALTEQRWMMNYFWFEGTGPVDIERLRQSCFQVVHDFDVLRTVFLSSGSRFWQVVLQKLEPVFSVIAADDIDAVSKVIYEQGLSSDLRVEDPFVGFFLVKHRHSYAHRLIMRISHAQYDGVSLPTIFGRLKEVYDGNTMSSSPTFSSYTYEVCVNKSEEAFEHWRELLAGSSMTEFVTRQKPELRKVSDPVIGLTEKIPYLSLTEDGITFASVVKSAWALILAQLAANHDVVFGHTISGRNVSVGGVDQIVGPCLNVVPVRVGFQRDWKVIDLLRYVQDQQLANVPFESVGFRDIIKNCTNWPQWSYFSSVVQHQNIDSVETLDLGETVYHEGFMGADLDLVDVSILSSPMGAEVEIALTTAQSVMSQESAEELLQLLCKTVTAFCSDVSAELPPLSEHLRKSPIIPTAVSSPQTSAETRSLKLLSRNDAVALPKIVKDIWTEILPSATEIPANGCFFELGGDLVGIAHVALALRDRQLSVSLEKLVEKSRFTEMVDMIATQYLAASVRRA
ncbi:hypothetical protein AJ80_03708 [Polytolypa hystricis UAMH7299]|uniref:Carrier domain-containing protein n=1 Tax=Polytolypa hystricis (strain UAMH7299) TaxID=1447883 RepID=A0A2B7YGL2_POLH7|nr:hypothetical protein AJ80_03708 [Polytolypa hystricis UAMH7299]